MVEMILEDRCGRKSGKEINLQIARRLKTYLEASDVTVVMTREDDRGLYEETNSSKKWQI